MAVDERGGACPALSREGGGAGPAIVASGRGPANGGDTHDTHVEPQMRSGVAPAPGRPVKRTSIALARVLEDRGGDAVVRLGRRRVRSRAGRILRRHAQEPTDP